MAGRGQGRRSRRSGGSQWGAPAPGRRFPRVARVNEVLRQVLADELERLAVADERLTLLTITAVDTDPDYRRAKVLFSTLEESHAEALAEARPRLQAAVSRQVRLKWTPTLSFEADPAIAGGRRIEEILRGLQNESPVDPSLENPSLENPSGEGPAEDESGEVP
jgi:ribosome-binding factor A